MDGLVVDILTSSLNDGPGIRTAIFLKGCPLNCKWCHNPESISPEPQIFKNIDGSTRTYGELMSVESIVAKVIKDRPFFEQSGGGVTLSGGEPLFQYEFAKALLTAFKQNGIHTCLDTTGFISKEKLEQIAPLVDVFHYDFKHGDSSEHKKWTGVPNELILANLELLNSRRAKIILRCPIIPGVNDTELHFKHIAELAKKYTAIQKIDLLPYHHYHSFKCEGLGLTAPDFEKSPPDAEEIYRSMLAKASQ
ncbi:MAG: glycyl-radical enzyme activating protein [Fibrobacteres bacterium]|nr:glycyl-radical enzyme activating protein [Fibrobacterota bacterium]